MRETKEKLAINGGPKTINKEFLGIMDDNLIKMSKFTVQINDLKLDKTTQDSRMLKMKIWLHFDKFFHSLKVRDAGCDCNIYDVADVQISDTTSAKFQFLGLMHSYIREINQIIQS